MKTRIYVLLFSTVLGPGLFSCGTATNRSDDGATQRRDKPKETECAEPGSVGDGLRCSCATDCLPGATCGTETDFGEPGGLCVRLCESGDDACPNGTACFDLVELYGAEVACTGSCDDDSDCGALSCRDGACCLSGLCRPECESTSDCEVGRLCDAGFCIGHCVDDSDCESGECNHYSGTCNSRDASKAGLHKPCLRHEDCRSDYCHAPSSTCESNCSVSLGGCPEKALCIEVDPESDLGNCAVQCSSAQSCPAEFECIDIDDSTQACALLEPDPSCTPAEGGALDPCECAAQCASGRCARESVEGFPGGACIVPCDAPDDCEEDETCGSGYCAPVCKSGGCGPGRVCGSSGYCRAACFEDEECTSGICNVYSGSCVDEEPTGAGVLGECVAHEDCKSEFCASFGSCLTLCSTERGACPDDATCLADSGETGVCTYPCGTDGEMCESYGLNCIEEFCQ